MTEHAINIVTKEVLSALKAAGANGARDLENHSIFSPSGSHTWAHCSGALIPGLFAPDTAGEDAAYGTVAHGVAEQWLKTGEPPTHLIGDTEVVKAGGQTFDILIDEVMLAYVEQYVDWCIFLPGDHFVEERVDHSDLTPIDNQGGTADHAVCEPGVLTITDLKMGKGVQVFAKNNTQAILYAWGFFRRYDEKYHFQKIVIRIAQPRLNHFDVWEITREELIGWADWLKDRAYAAWVKGACRTPGQKQCEFCKIKHDCRALAVFVMRVLTGDVDALDDPITQEEMDDFAARLEEGSIDLKPVDIGTLTVAQKAKLSNYRKMVESFFERIVEDLERRANAGEDIPGKKLVEGRSNRVFASVEKAVETLEFLGLSQDVYAPRKMITPAQSEDALLKLGYKRKQMPLLLGSVVKKPSGKPTLVDEDDPRPSLKASLDDVFTNLDEEETL